MTALDTNVVVRLITKDDAEQLQHAEEIVQAGPCLVTDTVLLETAWVLRSNFGASASQIEQELRAVLGLPNVEAANPLRARQALDDIAAGLDVADAFHRAGAEDAERLVTFDRRFVQRAVDSEGIPVELLG